MVFLKTHNDLKRYNIYTTLAGIIVFS